MRPSTTGDVVRLADGEEVVTLDQERWRRVEELFHAALERVPEARQAFLSDACEEDTEVLRQVELLLAKEEQAGSFLERPAIDDLTVTLNAAGEPPGPAIRTLSDRVSAWRRRYGRGISRAR